MGERDGYLRRENSDARAMHYHSSATSAQQSHEIYCIFAHQPDLESPLGADISVPHNHSAGDVQGQTGVEYIMCR